MSVQTKISCPYCGHTIAELNKKGIESLHTSIGIQNIKCDFCQRLIRTGHRPFSEMSILNRVLEIFKISLNIMILVGILGSMLGFFLGWLINEYLLESESPFNIYIICLTLVLLIAMKVRLYVNWSKSVSEYIDENGDWIYGSQYDHPDW